VGGAHRCGAAGAQRDLKEGNQLFAIGEYQRALERYQEAYRRVPSVKLFFNLAQTYRLLGRDVDRRGELRAVPGRSPDTPSEVRREAQQHLARCSVASGRPR
jgi:tetratricopeptide (TPR) repeat protein